jgi:thioredoxin reductase (NADPH)
VKHTSPDGESASEAYAQRRPLSFLLTARRRRSAATSAAIIAAMRAPLLMAVDDDVALLRNVEQELHDRYARAYRIECCSSAAEALTRVEALATADEEVALVLAAQGLSGVTGTDLLGRVRRLHPHAKLGLLLGWENWGDQTTGLALFEAMTRGRVDHYVMRPSGPSDERFHSTISTFLLEWAEVRRLAPNTVHVIGETWSGRAYELRQVLGRCAFPHTFLLADSNDARALLRDAGTDHRFPLLVMPDGSILTDPSDADVARAAGVTVDPEGSDFDLVIIGNGPAGLSAAVYGASEGLRTLVVDKAGLGGQATSSSLIRNYLGFPPGIGGGALARKAYEQAWVFGASFAFMQEAVDLRREGERIHVRLSNGGLVTAHAVVLATGASYRRLDIPELEALNGAGVVYGAAATEAPATAGNDVYVLGGANSAGQAALHLARYARHVTLVVRASSLGVGMSHYLTRQVEVTPKITVRLGTDIVGGGGDGWLERLTLRSRASGETETVAADGLFLMIGARPHTEWLPAEIERDAEGFVVTGGDLSNQRAGVLRRPLPLETSLPGVLAAGDVRHGSVRRVASAVGDGSIAVQSVHRILTARSASATVPPGGQDSRSAQTVAAGGRSSPS